MEENMNIPVCVRDGCKTATIQIEDFNFQIDLSELLEIVQYARLEMRESLLCNADLLMNVLHAMDQVLRLEMRDNSATKAETAKNLKRWQETGCGGHTDLKEVWKVLGEASLDDWRLPWEQV
jgi:hypothetical protein